LTGEPLLRAGLASDRGAVSAIGDRAAPHNGAIEARNRPQHWAETGTRHRKPDPFPGACAPLAHLAPLAAASAPTPRFPHSPLRRAVARRR